MDRFRAHAALPRQPGIELVSRRGPTLTGLGLSLVSLAIATLILGVIVGWVTR